MSKASCCCGLSPSAADGVDTEARIEAKAAQGAIQKRVRNARLRNRIFPNISLSQPCNPWRQIQTGNGFAGKLSDQTLARFSHPYLLSLTAMTSISTRKPGLASAATPTTDRAGRLG